MVRDDARRVQPRRLVGALPLMILLVVAACSTHAHAQCAPGFQLFPYVISRWGDTSTDVQNCNQVYIQRQWEKMDLGMEVGGFTFPPTNWFATDFDDSSWGAGILPFAGSIQCEEEFAVAVPGFPNIGVANTVWDANDDNNPNDGRNSYLAVRLKFFLAPNLFFRTEFFSLAFIVDNDLIEIYVNGQSQTFDGAVGREGCSGVTQIVSNQLDSSFLVPENNVIAFLAEDRGSQSYLNYELVVSVCELAPVANFTCSLTTPPAQPCMRPCSSDTSQCELQPDCLLEGLVADENGNCLCELVDEVICPSIEPGFIPGVCYPKTTRQSIRLLSCDNTGTELCRAPS
ncbi:hypothetical protein FVE85_1346 [Porphyridium purpureum]|uniref:PA14 domain-containing protein n=1 Tax=Porphyridium purpureum TaxID=35688 RepID=A0A5J4YHK6_PORPP|nr:hypothetical protein FVE85_1346 [Porphyridium purpureum]|eukprot:POR7509..scf251_18